MSRFIRLSARALLLLMLGAPLPTYARAMLWYDDGRGNPVPYPTQSEVPSSQPIPGGRVDRTDAPAPPATAPATSTAAVAKEGDSVVTGTLLALAAIWLGSCCIVAAKAHEQSKLTRQARHVEHTFWTEGTLEKAIDALEAGSAFHRIVESGLGARQAHAVLEGNRGRPNWVAIAILAAVEEIEERLERGFAALAMLGIGAPCVGLVGTVWRFRDAPDESGTALLLVAASLLIALLIALGYNRLGRRKQHLVQALRAFADDLQAVMLNRGTTEGLDWLPASAGVATAADGVQVV